MRYDDGTKKTVARRDVEPMYIMGDVVKARQEKQHNRYWPAEIVEVRKSTQGIETLPGLCQARSHMTRPQVYRNGTYDIRPYPDGELRDMEYQIPCSSVRPARASGDAYIHQPKTSHHYRCAIQSHDAKGDDSWFV